VNSIKKGLVFRFCNLCTLSFSKNARNIFYNNCLLSEFLKFFNFVFFTVSFRDLFYFLLLCWVWLHCNIAKVLMMYQTQCSLLSPPPFLEQFQQVSFLHLHTCVYIVCTIFILPPPFPSTSPLPPVQITLATHTPGQNLFYPPVLLFCRRKNIKWKKRNTAFLLVWDSYYSPLILTQKSW
jgi:hypothetical protein